MKQLIKFITIPIVLILLLITFIPVIAAVLYANLEADIYPGTPYNSSNPTHLIVYDGDLIFAASGLDGTFRGHEVWRFDGTTAEMVEDFFPGSSDSIDESFNLVPLFTEYNSNLYFSCEDATGIRLCRYDGNDVSAVDTAGVSPLVPIDAYHTSMVVYEGYLYFRAASSTAASGRQLYRYSDSGAGSITQVSDTSGDGLNGFDPYWMTVYDGELYMRAIDNTAEPQTGEELWKCDICDGTDFSLVADINPNAFEGSQPGRLTIYNGNLLFFANDGTNGCEIWSYNSTTGNAAMVEDAIPGDGINPTTDSIDMSDDNAFRNIVYNGVLYFATNDGTHGNELWSYDGTIASLVEDINPGVVNSSFDYPIIYDGEMYFTAENNDFVYPMLYSYDGTDISPAYDPAIPPWGLSPKFTTIYNGVLHASAVYLPTSDPTSSVGWELVSFQVNPPGEEGEEEDVGTTDIDLPDTGFAPDRITKLPTQGINKQYSDLGRLWIEIPDLNIEAPIMGVPAGEDGWDLRWLSDQIGWLEGTAFPTWAGNSALTAHVYDANGLPGPFKDLDSLEWGDVIKVHFYGQEYTYEVRSVEEYIHTGDSSAVLKHEELPWLTLITCQGYDPESDSYNWRIVVKAVQTEIK